MPRQKDKQKWETAAGSTETQLLFRYLLSVVVPFFYSRDKVNNNTVINTAATKQIPTRSVSEPLPWTVCCLLLVF